MPLFEAIRLALSQIRVQKLKSFFTLLGVTIGVMFLIAVVSIVEGMGRYMEEDLIGKLIPINTFELRHRPNINMGDMDESTWQEYRRRPRLKEQDIPPVAATVERSHAKWYVLAEDQEQATSRYARPKQVQVFAVDGDFFGVKKMGLTSGRAFSSQEVESGANVIVVGPDIVEHFFPGLQPLGRELRVGGIPYVIVGVAESQGSAFGISFDKFIVAPYRAPIHRLLNTKDVIDAIVIQAPSPQAMQGLQEEVRQTMRAHRHLRPGQKDNFSLQTSDSALAFWNKLKSYLVLAGILLPAVGVVVGAIVIMNIMLVAVAERTREIGIRKALGAKRRDIMAQFLVESATLATFGAIIGILLGVLVAKVISSATPLPTSVAPWSVVAAVILGGGVGIVSGAYPASRASRLDPITALRQE